MYKAPLFYFAVVLIGYVVDFSVYSLMLVLGAWLVLANTLAFMAGAAVNAVLIRKYVFSNNRFRARTDIVLTLLVNILFFVLGTGLLSWLVGNIDMNPYGAKVLTNGLTFAGNFSTRAVFFRTT